MHKSYWEVLVAISNLTDTNRRPPTCKEIATILPRPCTSQNVHYIIRKLRELGYLAQPREKGEQRSTALTYAGYNYLDQAEKGNTEPHLTHLDHIKVKAYDLFTESGLTERNSPEAYTETVERLMRGEHVEVSNYLGDGWVHVNGTSGLDLFQGER